MQLPRGALLHPVVIKTKTNQCLNLDQLNLVVSGIHYTSTCNIMKVAHNQLTHSHTHILGTFIYPFSSMCQRHGYPLGTSVWKTAQIFGDIILVLSQTHTRVLTALFLIILTHSH